MRIIGTIDHPALKITVFKTDNRLSVKFESGLYEQTFKFRSGDGVETLEDVQRLADGPFLDAVEAGLRDMHRARLEAMSRSLAGEGGDEFEPII